MEKPSPGPHALGQDTELAKSCKTTPVQRRQIGVRMYDRWGPKAHGFGAPHGNLAKQVGFDQRVPTAAFWDEEPSLLPPVRFSKNKRRSWIHDNVPSTSAPDLLLDSMAVLMTERVAAAAGTASSGTAAAAAAPADTAASSDFLSRAATVVEKYCTCLPGRTFPHLEGCAAAGQEWVWNAAADAAVTEMQAIAKGLEFLHFVPPMGSQWLPAAVGIYMKAYHGQPVPQALPGHRFKGDSALAQAVSGPGKKRGRPPSNRGGASRHPGGRRNPGTPRPRRDSGEGSDCQALAAGSGGTGSRGRGPGSRGGLSQTVISRMERQTRQPPATAQHVNKHDQEHDAGSDQHEQLSETELPSELDLEWRQKNALATVFQLAFGQFDSRIRNPEHVFKTENSIMFCLPTLKVLQKYGEKPSVVRDDSQVTFLYLCVTDDKDKSTRLKSACSVHTLCGAGMPKVLPTHTQLLHSTECDTLCECAKNFIDYVEPAYSTVARPPTTIITRLITSSQPWKTEKDGLNSTAEAVKAPLTSWGIKQVLVLTIASDYLANSSVCHESL